MKNADIRFVFFGTPDISVASLDALAAVGLMPTLIVTQPDKPAGRKQTLNPPPVKIWAEAHEIDVLQPETLTPEFIAELGNSEWDVFVLVAYGKILPQALIDVPRRGIVNMHPSLLPKLRGPSPIRSAILSDEKDTGVSVMLLDNKMDHGPVIAQASVALESWPPYGRMLDGLLAQEGGELLAEALPLWVRGEIDATEQEHDKATYCGMFTKEDGLVDLQDDPYQNLLKIRALDGWPGAYTFFKKNDEPVRVLILEASLDTEGSLSIETVKPEGKEEMIYSEFVANGYTPVLSD